MNGFVKFLLVLSIWMTLGAAKPCTRIFHSAIINNQTLFINGGEVRYFNQSKPISEAVRELLKIDLSKPWKNSDSNLSTAIHRPYNSSHPKLNAAPWLNEGASFSDGSNLYFYGGYTSGNGGPDKLPPPGTWRYDIQNDHWTSEGFTGFPVDSRLYEGVTAQSSVHKKAYYLGGVSSSGKTHSVSGFRMLDQKTLEWRELSTSGLNQYETIADGYMNLIEDIGDEGILVAFGGNTHPAGQGMSVLSGSQDNASYHNSMEFISVYDIADDKWYTQQSSGDIPRWRMSGCSVVTPAQDLSSFSIYMFGGMGNATANSDGDVYVLSLPSFRWIRVGHPQNNDIRIKHKCQLAGKHTMLVTGGIIPTNDREYDPKQENCDKGTFANGLGMFNLSSHQWRSDWVAEDDGKYTIHSDISKVIGGGETGSATLKEPEGGFNNTQLEALFQNTHTATTSETGQSDSSNSISKGAIAGATVGAVAGAAAIGGLAFFLIIYRRRRNAKQDAVWDGANHSREQPDRAELHGEARPLELAGDVRANMAEMPSGNEKDNQNVHRHELEGSTAVEMEG